VGFILGEQTNNQQQVTDTSFPQHKNFDSLHCKRDKKGRTGGEVESVGLEKLWHRETRHDGRQDLGLRLRLSSSNHRCHSWRLKKKEDEKRKKERKKR